MWLLANQCSANSTTVIDKSRQVVDWLRQTRHMEIKLKNTDTWNVKESTESVYINKLRKMDHRNGSTGGCLKPEIEVCKLS